MIVESLPPTVTVLANTTPLRLIVNVPDDADVLATTMSVTTVVVADGTVYRVVLVVAAAVRARVFDVVAISYYAFLRLRP
jgi:hypothetical protein